jgi:alpha-D-xyloside xylohydrolase
MANAYVLASGQAVYEGQRATDPQKRVFILTRSAFAGSQRYAAAAWSGDVSSDWDSLRKQVPAGLNMALSGIPWWTTDVGGFAVPRKWSRRDARPEDVEAWRELVTRWFQYATFCPLLRVHGQFPYREMWHFGDEGHPAYRTQLAFDRLRYRMLPYIYSLAGAATQRHATPMRPLVMDFREDPEVLEIGDQFLFGPSLLVSPVTAPGATERSVYLPRRDRDDGAAPTAGGLGVSRARSGAGAAAASADGVADPGSAATELSAGWYDFWTGVHHAGGQRIDAPAPYERLPVFVKAGSILPMGPELQHTDERAADPLTLWVYTGRDAAFELYADDGVSYSYEQGAFATIPIAWDEAPATLTIGPRRGSFPGMLSKREIRVVVVSPQNPVPHSATPTPARTLTYDGGQLTVRGSQH